ncbi:hypothetical protein JAAARDRAFT_49575 [Jaapia argillacea MUCL 33604]|uniref:Uncharacterized protein n=1 Tax=Jaapia argillacea MUCL 33604 TaxID=933084 RepID=A0A067PUG2_9AGAM|nr:hypothetical protein JAAARDRAFT_49575 [Jaapia argillacea MUCL 33604]
MSAATPLRLPRLVVLLLACVFGVVSFALGIDAIVQSNQQKALVRRSVPKGTVVHIDTEDILSAGGVMTAACGLLGLFSFFFAFTLLAPRLLSSNVNPPISTRTLPLQSRILAFLTIFILATEIPVSIFVAKREAKVTAFIGKIQLPDSIIQSVEKSLGVTRVYHELKYLRNIAILPWVAFLLALIATVLSYLAWTRANRTSIEPESRSRSGTVGDNSVAEKGSKV